MRSREIPGTGLRVSEIGLPLDAFGRGFWDDGDAASGALVAGALAGGVTLFDVGPECAPRAEALVRAHLARRADAVVVAHARPPERRSGREGDWEAATLIHAAEAAAGRLGRASVDILVVHGPPPAGPRGDAVRRALEVLVESGTVRCVAFPADGTPPAAGAALVASPVNLLDPHLPDGDLPVLALDPLAGGLLEGKYTSETLFANGDPRRGRDRTWLVEGVARVEALRAALAPTPGTIAQCALNLLRANPRVVSMTPQVLSAEQLVEFVAVADLPAPTDAEVERVRRWQASEEAGRPDLTPQASGA